MARKSLGKAAKVLGGLGAMYALSKLPVGEGVRPEDVNQGDAAKYRRDLEQRLAQLRAPAPAGPESVQPRVRLPNPSEAHVPYTPDDGRVRIPPELLSGYEKKMKKGGTAKGWGKARGARKAKVY
jgi:hypothetical protein